MTDTNNEMDFPGYPHYAAKEDIMNQKEIEKVNIDVDNLSRSNKVKMSNLADQSIKSSTPAAPEPINENMEEDEIKEEASDADITKDDLIDLGEDADIDPAKVDKLEGEDDLDFPGAEEDDADEEIGEEDEENNYYSLGGDAHENLEEDKG